MSNPIPRRVAVIVVSIAASIAFSACSSTRPIERDAARAATKEPSRPSATPPQRAIEPISQAQAEEPLVLQATEKAAPESTPENEPVPGKDSLFFAFGKTEIDRRGTDLLSQHALRLKENPTQVVTLVAFTDNVGSRSYNLALAEERMSAVSAELRKLGAPSRQIRRRSAGLSKLSATCSTPACRQKMRRVELVYD